MSVALHVREYGRRPAAVLEGLLDDAHRAAVLRAAVAALEPDAEPPQACRLKRVHTRNGGGFVAEVTSVGASGVERQYFIDIPAGGFAERAAEIARRCEKLRQRSRNSDACFPLIHADPENGLFVRPRGTDEMIDGLAPLGDPQTLRVQLPDGLMPSSGSAAVELLAHRLNRRAVLGVKTNNGAELIVKLYKKGASKSRNALEITSLLELTSFGENSPVRVPRGAASLRAWNGHVMERAPGVQLFYISGYDSRCGLALSGAALGRLHRLPLRLQKTHTVSDELELLQSWTQLVSDMLPLRAQALRAALRQVRGALLAGGQPAATLVHRDFHGGQVLVSGPRATLIDFDTVCNGEPAQDIGNFLGHLDLSRIERPSSGERADEFFLAGYAEACRDPDAARVEAHRRATQLRLACIYAFSDGHLAIWPRLLDLAVGDRP